MRVSMNAQAALSKRRYEMVTSICRRIIEKDDVQGVRWMKKKRS
jgi:hypothetical protein